MSKSHMAQAAVSDRATYQDVLDAPPHTVAEIVEGTLYIHPRPAPPHTIAGSGLGGFLNQAFQYGRGGPGGWWILDEPELHLGNDILVPDIGGWRRDRMPETPTTAYFMLAPDWVCEVLSPSTRKLDLGGKRAVYAREGVGYLWLVDPDARSLEAFQLRGTEWVMIDSLYDNAPVSSPPFEATSFDLGDLWPTHTVHKAVPSKSTVQPQPELIEASK